MQTYDEAPPKRGMSTAAIALIVVGVLVLLMVGTCGAGAYFLKRKATAALQELADGGAFVVASPEAVRTALSGARKDYVGSWRSAKGSTLDIAEDGAMRLQKNGDGDGMRQTITAPIAEFRGDDLVVRMLFTMTVRVSSPPHKVGDHWEMTADGMLLEKK
jgi:hypothetical protein